MKLVFICAVCGVGKSTVCEYLKDNNMLSNFEIFDIDDLENINNYKEESFSLFYENALKNAVKMANDKDMVIGACISPNDLSEINVPQEIESINMIAITCSESELYRRLKERDEARNCSSDEFIDSQVVYQNWILENINLYQLHLDNTNVEVKSTAEDVVKFINNML